MDLLNDVLDLIQKFVIIGGGVLLVFGLVNLGTSLLCNLENYRRRCHNRRRGALWPSRRLVVLPRGGCGRPCPY